MNNFLFLGLPAVLLSVVLLSSMNIQPIINAQVSNSKGTKSNSPQNLTKDFISSQQKKATSYYKGESIQIFTVLNMYSVEQWQPIDNLTSHGWEIKSVIPASLFQSGRQFLFIVLEKMTTK